MIEGLAINGGRSAIARSLVSDWLGNNETVIQVKRGEDMPLDALRYLFCQGLLYDKRRAEQSEAEQHASYDVNCGWIINQCQRIIRANDRARICVIGSESVFAGSFDQSYADSKRGLHTFAERYALRTKEQSLVCIAPSIISDAGMTLRRTDVDNLERRRMAHPKGRFLDANEVAGLIHHVLYIDRGYLSGVTIRMNGGAHNGRSPA